MSDEIRLAMDEYVLRASRRLAADAIAAAKDAAPRATPNYPPARKLATRTVMSTEALYSSGAISREEAVRLGYTPPAPPPRWKRLKWQFETWWYDHKPHVHLGPCDQGDDYL